VNKRGTRNAERGTQVFLRFLRLFAAIPFSCRTLIIVLLCLAATTALAVDRFPRPEFDTGYVMPSTTTPQPRSDLAGYMDILVLTAALGLGAFFTLKARSRRAVVLLCVASLLYFGFWRKGCVCPIGAIQNVTLALFNSSYTIPITVVAFFVIPLVFTLFFGRTFCAAVCPLGAIQDIVVVKPVTVPRPLTFLLGMIPYIYLGLAVLMAATGLSFIICQLDPFVGFFRLNANFEMLVFGGLLLALGMFVARPYCRFICPYGVLLGWLSRFSKFHVTITPTDCIQCRLCEDSCPFDAILKPEPASMPESRSKGVRRLALILVLLPILLIGGGWLGSRIDAPLARASVRARIAERIQQEDIGAVQGTTLESDGFRDTGELTTDLFRDTLAVRKNLRRGGWILGAFVGLAFCGRLLALSTYRKREDYVPDSTNCLSCARCFLSCPKEHQKRKEMMSDE
jgi:NosR/NirI family nitrous oxide reductase transcriptional regulator